MISQRDKNRSKSSREKKIILLAISIVLCMAIITVAVIYMLVSHNDNKTNYNKALTLISEKNYEAAYEILFEIKDYEAAQECLEKFQHKIVKDTYVDSENQVYYTEYEYDQNGNCILENKKYDGYREEFIKYTYDDNKCINEVLVDVYCGNTKIQKETTYFYTKDAGICFHKTVKSYAATDYNGIGYDEHLYYYTYDNNQKIATEERIDIVPSDWGGFLYVTKNKKIYEYNDKGLVKAEKLYSYDTYIDDYIIEYEYDEFGNLVKELNDSGSHKTINEYFYNEKGSIIKETGGSLSNEESYYVKNYVYDADDNIIKEEIQNTQEAYVSENTYDKYGRLVKKNILYKTPHVAEETHTYEYEIFYVEGEENDKDKNDINNVDEKIDIKKIYASKIEEYMNVANMDYDYFEEQYKNDKLSVSDMMFYYHMYGGSVKYAFYDVDKNGIEELLFGYDGYIIDIYTTDGKEVIELNIPAGERSTIHILSTGIILVEGSNSGFSSGMTRYYIDSQDNKVSRGRISDIYYDMDYESYESDYDSNRFMVPSSVYLDINERLMNMSVTNEISWNELKTK